MHAARLRRGFTAGALAGLATAGAMYLVADLVGLLPLPTLLEEPVLAAMPGPVFGFLIDRLQHAGKVLEEAGLLGTMVVGLGVLGAAHAEVRARRPALPALNLAAGAVAWAVVCLAVLPLAGQGLLGIQAGLITPIAWALLFTLYATLLEGASRPPPPHDPGRRELLRVVPVGAAALGVAYAGLRLGPRWYATVFGAPEASLSGPPAAITPPGRFYVVSKNFTDPVVSAAGWNLELKGAVAAPYRLALDELRALASVEETVTLECISNEVGGPQMSTGVFRGVPLRDLVARAQPRSEAAWVVFRARDGYSEFLPLAMVEGAPEVLVAHMLDGAPLPNAHGFPARMLIPGHYGMKGPKWLDSIELAAARSGGYWEGQGWNPDARVRTTSRIDTPAAGDILRAGQAVQVAGVAFAGTRGISAVELSTDGGSTWSAAQLEPSPGPLAWTLWSYSWRPAAGSHRLVVRATDGSGERQDTTTRPSFPDGSSGLHAIRLSAAG